MEKEVLVKIRDTETDPKYGKKPEARTVEELLKSSFVNLDKPAGPSSHQASDYVKRILNVSKAGHSGTLDPMVTGILTVAIGDATKTVQAMLLVEKVYVAVMHLHKDVSAEKLKKAFDKFIGEIEQMVPVRAAVKRQLRKRKIYSIKLIEFDAKNKDVLFEVSCQAGTYVRKLIHDMGQFLKVGAHMTELRRTRVGQFNEDRNLITLQDLADAYYFYVNGKKNNDEKMLMKGEKLLKKYLMPVEIAVEHLSKIWIHDSAIYSICTGQTLKVPGIVKLNEFEKEKMVAIMSMKDELVALGQSLMNSNEIMINEKGIAAKSIRVIMEKDIYYLPLAEIGRKSVA